MKMSNRKPPSNAIAISMGKRPDQRKFDTFDTERDETPNPPQNTPQNTPIVSNSNVDLEMVKDKVYLS
jgi:hypothetical protein